LGGGPRKRKLLTLVEKNQKRNSFCNGTSRGKNAVSAKKGQKGLAVKGGSEAADVHTAGIPNILHKTKKGGDKGRAAHRGCKVSQIGDPNQETCPGERGKKKKVDNRVPLTEKPSGKRMPDKKKSVHRLSVRGNTFTHGKGKIYKVWGKALSNSRGGDRPNIMKPDKSLGAACLSHEGG